MLTTNKLLTGMGALMLLYGGFPIVKAEYLKHRARSLGNDICDSAVRIGQTSNPMVGLREKDACMKTFEPLLADTNDVERNLDMFENLRDCMGMAKSQADAQFCLAVATERAQ